MIVDDKENAFNNADRKNFLAATKATVPEIYRPTEYVYSQELVLYAGDVVVFNSNGAQQGCPLGSTLYAIGSLELLLKILRECPSIKISPHYLDDGTFGGKITDLIKAVEIS